MPTTVVAIVEPGRGFRFWHISEIFIGPGGPITAKYVPNVNDAVMDWDNGVLRVTAVDSITNESTLVPHSFTNLNGGIVQEDVLLSSGPNRVSESFRLYINTSVTPHRMAIDGRLHIYTNNASYVKVFKGTDISATGHVISAMYNNMGVYLSENIPLETVGIHGVTNLSIKAPQEGYSTEPLIDNDIATVVFYSATNAVLYIARVLAVNSNFVHTADLTKRFIVGIELLSPYKSVTDDHLLEYPVNMIVQSASLQGRLIYNDATTEDLPIDGTRFVLTGINRYIATEAGNSADISLIYNLQPNEYAYNVSAPLPNRFIQEEYKITTVQADGAYTVKLFVVPYWSNALGRWALDYYLYDLDRDTKLLVTSHIEHPINTPAFDGTLLNAWQFLTVGINLNDADNAYLGYQYVQTFAIQLKNGGTNTTSDEYFLLEYQLANTYGSGIKAISSPDLINVGQKRLDISQNLTNVQDWLNRVYYPLKPLILQGVETTPPVPTHVILRIGASWTRELAIADAVNFIEGITTPIAPGTLVRLEFIRRESVDLELAVVSLNVKQ